MRLDQLDDLVAIDGMTSADGPRGRRDHGRSAREMGRIIGVFALGAERPA